MKLTIVTTTYNQEKYIGKAIEGFVMQKTNFPFKIVISNDNSTDNTLQVIKEYQKKYPELIEVRTNEKNLGAMGNFIDTLSRIKDTEYVALCDGDDFWTDENKLQKQVDFLDENKDFSICCHKAKVFYQNGEKEESIIPQGIPEITTLEDLIVQNYIVANSVVYRWKFSNKNNLKDIFPANITPGDYYVHLIHAKDGKIKMFDEVMSCYRRHEDGMWWSNDDENKEKFSMIYARKMLNFYNVADKYLETPKEAFYEQRKYIMHDAIVTYLKNEKYEELRQFKENEREKEIFDQCMTNMINAEAYLVELWKIKNSRVWKLRTRIKNLLEKKDK